MSRKHICVLTQQYSLIRSGIGIYARNVVPRLIADGWKVTLVLPEESVYFNIPKEARIMTFSMPKQKSAFRWVSIAKKYAIIVKKLINYDCPDILLCTDARECCYFPKQSPPIVGMINDNYAAEVEKTPFAYRGQYSDWLLRWSYYKFTRYYEGIAYKKLAAAVCNSHFVANSVKRIYGLSEKNLFVVHKSVDPSQLILKSPPKQQAGLILTIGGNPERKGIPSLIKVMPRLLNDIPNAKLEIIGETASLVKQARKYKVYDSIVFRGFLSHEEVVKAHYRSSVFAMPSLIEAFGLVYLEAAICGRPFIATTNGGIKEIFSEKNSAIFVNPKDIEQIRRALFSVLTDDQLAAKIANKGQSIALRYTVDFMYNKTLPIIESVIDERR